MSTDRVILGRNDAGDHGLWISKPGSNVRAVSIPGAFDETASKDFAEMEATTGWTAENATIEWDNPNNPVYNGGGSLIFKQTGDGAFLYSPEWPTERTGDTIHTFEADGNTYPILEMNVRNIRYGQPATSEMSVSVVRHSYMNSKLGHFEPTPGEYTYYRIQGLQSEEIELKFSGTDLSTTLATWPYSDDVDDWWYRGDVVDLILTIPKGYDKSGEKIIYRSRITRTAGGFIYLACNWAFPPVGTDDIGFMNYYDTFIPNAAVPDVTPSITYAELLNSDTVVVNRSRSFQSEPHNYDSRLDSSISVPHFNKNSTYTLNEHLSIKERDQAGTPGEWKTLEWDFRIDPAYGGGVPSSSLTDKVFKVRDAYWSWQGTNSDLIYYILNGDKGETDISGINVGDTFELHYKNSNIVDTVTAAFVEEYPLTNSNRIVFTQSPVDVANAGEPTYLYGYTPALSYNTQGGAAITITEIDKLIKTNEVDVSSTSSSYIGSKKEISNWTLPEYAVYTPNGVNWNSKDDSALNGSDLYGFPYLSARERLPATNGYGGTIQPAKIAGVRFQFNADAGGEAGGTHYEIASIRAKKADVPYGLPAHPNSWKNLQFATGQVGGIDPQFSGLIHQTGIVTVGTDATDVGAEGGRSDWGSEGSSPTGVVHLADPLPYIPFILFQRYDGQSTDPVVAYPSNILDISYCGTLGNKLNMGLLEYKSSHTDPTLPSGHGGMSYSWAMRRIKSTGRDGIFENHYKLHRNTLRHSQDFSPPGKTNWFGKLGNFMNRGEGADYPDHKAQRETSPSESWHPGYDAWWSDVQYQNDIAGRNLALSNWDGTGRPPKVSGIWTRLNSPVVGRNNFKDIYEHPCAVSFPSGALETPTCWDYDTEYDGRYPSGSHATPYNKLYTYGAGAWGALSAGAMPSDTSGVTAEYFADVFRSRWFGPNAVGMPPPYGYSGIDPDEVLADAPWSSSTHFSPIDPRPGTVHEGLNQASQFGLMPQGGRHISSSVTAYGHRYESHPMSPWGETDLSETGHQALTQNFSFMSPMFWGQQRSWRPGYPIGGSSVHSGSESQYNNPIGEPLPDYDNPFLRGDNINGDRGNRNPSENIWGDEGSRGIYRDGWPQVPTGATVNHPMGFPIDGTNGVFFAALQAELEALGYDYGSVDENGRPIYPPQSVSSRQNHFYTGIEYGPTMGHGKWGDSNYLGGRMVSPMGFVAGEKPNEGPRFFSLWGDLHYVSKTDTMGEDNSGVGDQTTQEGYPNLAQINVSPGAVYKWMIIETLKMRTFAYVRAGSDKFEITARGALGREGYEEQSHGTWTRPTYRKFAAGDPNAAPGKSPKPSSLEIMWDQKDHTANGVLPPSIYTAEHISDWGWYGTNFFKNLSGTVVAPGRRTEGDQRHEMLPGFSYGGTAGFYQNSKPPWDWGGAQTWPVEPMNSESIHVARQRDPNESIITRLEFIDGVETPVYTSRDTQYLAEVFTDWRGPETGDGSPQAQLDSSIAEAFGTMGTMQNVNVPAVGALKSGWKPYSSRMTRYGKVSWGRDDMLYGRNARLHQNNADICPKGGGRYNDENNNWYAEGDGDNTVGNTAKFWGWGDPRQILVEDNSSNEPLMPNGISDPWGENYYFFNEAEYRVATPELGVGTGYGCHVQFWPPGGMVNMAYEPTLKGVSPAGGYSSMVRWVQGNDEEQEYPGRATEGIFHPRGVSQYEENYFSGDDDNVDGTEVWKQNQSYDLVNNNESTGKCRYRYYVLRIPANLDAMGGIDV